MLTIMRAFANLEMDSEYQIDIQQNLSETEPYNQYQEKTKYFSNIIQILYKKVSSMSLKYL